MAEGGIVKRPTQGIVGEAGPEAVIPLDRLEELFPGVDQGALEGGGLRGAESRSNRFDKIEGGSKELIDKLDEILRELRRLEPEVNVSLGDDDIAEAADRGSRKFINRRRLNK